MTTYHHSPVGIWQAQWSEGALIRFELLGDETKTPNVKSGTVAHNPQLRATAVTTVSTSPDNSLLLEKELQQFFAGKLQKFSVPYVLTGTAFQLAVWHALARIPFGETTTYGALAEQIGHPRAVRAVGTAVGKNPLPLLIGCHRVLGKNSLGGFAYGLECKQFLLTLEKKFETYSGVTQIGK